MTKNWMDLAEIQRDGAVFNNLMHALLGLYLWEFATSLDFEWAFITGRKRFRWPIIFYFLNRYSLVAAMVGIAVSLNVQTEVNCQALYTYNQIVGNAVIGFASINLSLRTMAVWEQKWWIVAPLVVLMMGQWSMLLQGVLLEAAWMPPQGCVIIKTANTKLAASFVYTMVYDALVLFLTAFKLATTGGIGRGQRSRLVDMIFSDGLIYFLIAFVSNTIATTFMLLNLNAIMSIIFNVPSAVASTIVATRAVRRLSNFLSAEPERFGAPKSSLAFRRGAQTPGGYATGASYAFGTQAGNTADATATAVTVPMDTFSQAASRADPEFNDDKIEETGFSSSSTDVEAQYESKPPGPRAF